MNYKDFNYEVDWIYNENDTHRVELLVSKDAVKQNGVRVPATPLEYQDFCDANNSVIPTAKIIDLIFDQSTRRIKPVTRVGGKITAICSPEDVSRETDNRISELEDTGIIDNPGKFWIIDERLDMVHKNPSAFKYGKDTAINYGWHDVSSPYTYRGRKIWQQPGAKHNTSHKDPSQVMRWVCARCMVYQKSTGEGVDMLTSKVISDPDLYDLLSYTKLNVLRYG